MARRAGLPVAEKPESQDICFVTEKSNGAFVSARAPEIRRGPIVDMSGKVLGEHRGIVHYTIGQREGLSMSSREALYVCAIEARKNRIVVGARKNLKVKALIARDLHVLLWPWPEKVLAATRYRKTVFPCSVSRKGQSVCATFDEEQDSVKVNEVKRHVVDVVNSYL